MTNTQTGFLLIDTFTGQEWLMKATSMAEAIDKTARSLHISAERLVPAPAPEGE